MECNTQESELILLEAFGLKKNVTIVQVLNIGKATYPVIKK